MTTIKIFKKGWNYSQDGPGNRLVYHLQGCNLHCPWCSNPEGISKEGSWLVYEEKLIATICPHGAIKSQRLDRALCRVCQTRECIHQNQNLGVQFSAKEYSIEALSAEVEQSRSLFFDGGGVTLTGGEPTLQFEAIRQFYEALKKAGIKTALETNGTHPRLSELFSVIDTLMIDLKHYDCHIHQETTGVDNHIIVANIRKAAEQHQNLSIRIPIIPGFNETAEAAQHFAHFLRELPSHRFTVELLPFHQYGAVKWERCGLEYPQKAAVLPDEQLQTIGTIFNQYGLNLIHT